MNHWHRHRNWVELHLISPALLQYRQFCNSYTIPTKAEWDLLPEPKDEGNKFHMVRGGVVTILKPAMATHLLYYSNVFHIVAHNHSSYSSTMVTV